MIHTPTHMYRYTYLQASIRQLVEHGFGQISNPFGCNTSDVVNTSIYSGHGEHEAALFFRLDLESSPAIQPALAFGAYDLITAAIYFETKAKRGSLTSAPCSAGIR